MFASDIMTAPAVTIDEEVEVEEIARLLLERHIGGVPVLADGRVVGMVNAADLLRYRQADDTGDAPSRPWWRRWFEADSETVDARDSNPTLARDVMTRQVVTVNEDLPLEQIAAIFAERSVRRILVLSKDRFMGVLTRTELEQALAQPHRCAAQVTQPPDEATRTRLVEAFGARLSSRPRHHALWVEDGIVHYQGHGASH